MCAYAAILWLMIPAINSIAGQNLEKFVVASWIKTTKALENNIFYCLILQDI